MIATSTALLSTGPVLVLLMHAACAHAVASFGGRHTRLSPSAAKQGKITQQCLKVALYLSSLIAFAPITRELVTTSLVDTSAPTFVAGPLLG